MTTGWGIEDNFATGNGTELAAPSQRLINYINSVYSPPNPLNSIRNYDDTSSNKWFGNTFVDLDQRGSGARLVGATLEYRIQAVYGGSQNDSLGLGFITGGEAGFTYGGYLGTAASGTSHIGAWNYGVQSNGSLNLGSLPNGTSVISSMQSYGSLDFVVQDDTAVDFLRLNVHYQGDYNTSNTDDIIKGFSGNDTLEGLTGNDILFGNEGNDLLDGGTGSNYLDGGTGYDTADYSNLGQGITLLPFGLVNKADGTQDQLVNIEKIVAGISTIDTIDSSTSSSSINANLTTGKITVITRNSLAFDTHNFDNVIGGNFNDTLTGNNLANQLYGGDGDDYLSGEGGDDILTGGDGLDILNGGAGKDTFVFNSPVSGNDLITDFKQGQDKLRISTFGFGVGTFDINNWSYEGTTGQLSFVSHDYYYVEDYDVMDNPYSRLGINHDSLRQPVDMIGVPEIIATFNNNSNFSLDANNFIFV